MKKIIPWLLASFLFGMTAVHAMTPSQFVIERAIDRLVESLLPSLEEELLGGGFRTQRGPLLPPGIAAIISGLQTFSNGFISNASSTFTQNAHVTGNLNASSSVFAGGSFIGYASSSFGDDLTVSGDLLASSTLQSTGLATFYGGFISPVSSTIRGRGTFSQSVAVNTSTPWAMMSVVNTGTLYSFVVADVADDASPFVIDADGNVAIGKQVPVSLLDISGTTPLRAENTAASNALNDVIQIFRSRSDATAPGSGFGGQLTFNLEGFTNNDIVGVSGMRSSWENNQTNDTTDRDADLQFLTTLDGSAAIRMTLNSIGRLGIGTTVPDTLLHVAGGSLVTGSSTFRSSLHATGNLNVSSTVNIGSGANQTITLFPTSGAVTTVSTTGNMHFSSSSASIILHASDNAAVCKILRINNANAISAETIDCPL